MWYSPLSELRENLSRLGANLKQSLLESARKTWESINEFARAHSSQGSDVQDAVVEEATEVKGNHSNCRGFFKGAASLDMNKHKEVFATVATMKTSLKPLKCYSCSVKRTVLYFIEMKLFTLSFGAKKERKEKRQLMFKRIVKGDKLPFRWFTWTHGIVQLVFWKKKKRIRSNFFFFQWHSAYF